MPQAKRSTSTRKRSTSTRSRATATRSRSSATTRFKQPAALKRLTTSLDTAQKALTELSKGSGRAGTKGAKDIYADLRGFVTSARRDSNKVAKALQREFDQAQKELAKAAKGTRSSARRSTSRSTSARSTGGRGTSRRTSSGSGSTRRTGSRRGTRKS